MFFVRMIVAICAVSFLLNGGQVRAPQTQGEVYPTTAHESAADVVRALSTLRTFCDDRPTTCEVMGEIGAVAKSVAAEAAATVARLLKEDEGEDANRPA